jgi:hypothetical protein
MHRLAGTTLLIVCLALGWTTPSAADVVTDWNQTILATVGVATPAGRGATPASLIDVAMVHLAMHDAAQAYDKRFESYSGAITGASGSSIVAVAKAALDVLAARFPLQAASLTTTYNNYIAGLVPPVSASDIAGGQAAGALAAANVITARMGDGSFPSSFPQFTGGTGPGGWRPNPRTPGMVARGARSNVRDRKRAAMPARRSPKLTSAGNAPGLSSSQGIRIGNSPARQNRARLPECFWGVSCSMQPVAP